MFPGQEKDGIPSGQGKGLPEEPQLPLRFGEVLHPVPTALCKGAVAKLERQQE